MSTDDRDETIKRLRREVTHMRKAAEERNHQLDALGIVWCSGGCPGGMLRYHPDREVTAQMVADLWRNAKRAASWYVARAGKCLPGTGREPAWARAREELQAAGVTSAEAEHQRLADAAERLVSSLDPDYVGDLPDALDALEVALRDRVRHMDLGAVARST